MKSIIKAQAGIAHLAIVGLIVVAGVAGIGTYVYKKSSAAVNTDTAAVCGRDGKRYPTVVRQNISGGYVDLRLSRDKTKFCAMTVSTGSGTKNMRVQIVQNDNHVESSYARREQKGKFSSYAGPVYYPCKRGNYTTYYVGVGAIGNISNQFMSSTRQIPC